MPTFNQLVRQGRQDKTYKSKAPVLQVGLNTLANKSTDIHAPQKRGVCTNKCHKYQIFLSDIEIFRVQNFFA